MIAAAENSGELPIDFLKRLRDHTPCDWTRGAIDAFFWSYIADDVDVAKQIMESEKDKIPTIKALRAAFDLSLKEGKEMVEEFERSGNAVWPKKK